MKKHPAKYTDALIPVLATMLRGRQSILDPFGGTGKIFDLHEYAGFEGARIEAIEIEPEWAALDERITVGDALALPFDDCTFDAICTSPTYGNRMADTLIDKYDRITYTSKLGRKLHANNSGGMQWGKKYRDFHERAWGEALRVMKEGGAFVLNIKNHIRAGAEQDVTAWHVSALEAMGMTQVNRTDVPTPSMRWGQNGNARVSFESVILFE